MHQAIPYCLAGPKSTKPKFCYNKEIFGETNLLILSPKCLQHQPTFIVWEKKQNVLSLCNESIGTCLTPKITDASDKSSCINAPAFA